MKKIFSFLAVMTFAVSIPFFAGFAVGSITVQKKAIEVGVAQYNPKEGHFEWILPEEK